MRKFLASGLTSLLVYGALAQTPQPASPQRPAGENEIIRITTALVEVDAVVVDKNDQIVSDLKLADFEVYENGKKQDLQFLEFVSIDAGSRAEGELAGRRAAPASDAAVARGLSAKEVKRVMAFVVDDVTIPREEIARVRQLLSDFVENKMQAGDLVAIVRTVGGQGLLEQFTTDKQILRRAISRIGVRSIPPHFATLPGSEQGRVTSAPAPLADTTATETVNSGLEFEGPAEGTNQVPRALLALSVSHFLIDSMRQIPGRKSLMLLSGGLPLFDLSRSGSIVGDISQLIRRLIDNATRSGVVINTMDVRGLTAAGAVARYVDTPGKSALGGGTFAGGDENLAGVVDHSLLGDRSPTEQLGLRVLANATGGVSVVNTNNFGTGLDRVLSRSRGYYRLAYRPSEKFDNKFRKIEVKVRRGGARVFTQQGYYGREDRPAGELTKEEQIMAAARSPLVKRDLDVATNLLYKFTPNNQAQLYIQTLIDARKLNFKRTPEGKYQSAFDVAGFVFDQLGRARGGISQTITTNLSEKEYQRALAGGIGHTASTQLPPGYYQVRLVVREAETGNVGTVSRYFEVPDLSNRQLAVSSLFLYAVDPKADAKAAPALLDEARVISRGQDLRYAASIYNAKLEGGKPQLRSSLVISQNGRVLHQEPEQPVPAPAAGGQVVKVGQLGLSRVAPGRYTLTLVVTDPLADKKRQTVTRSAEFTVVN